MNRTKKIAKILTSLQERSVKTKMSKDDELSVSGVQV